MVLGTVLASRYRVVRKLGEGGMGEVYLVEHLTLGRPQALKLIRPAVAQRRDLASRLRREARALERLRHPNIVAFYDFGELDDGRLYLTTEYVAGEPLGARIARGPLPVEQTLSIVRQLAHAIEHAHERGVVHRDLKPDNLLLVDEDDGAQRLKVLDFGIAKILAPDHVDSMSVSGKGSVFGTPEFMAPEQFYYLGQSEPRVDLYAAGCVAFALLTGRPPFSGRMMELMHRHLTEAPVAPSLVSGRLDIPPALDQLVLRCLAKPVDLRCQSARELVDAVDRIAAGDVGPGPVARGEEPTQVGPPPVNDEATTVDVSGRRGRW